ncbi:MAG: ORF6N domain-containing protein [Sulfuricurvum sp.]|nr:ORF6N domain-containing protein [Sulfuricurvum sp.]
MNEVTASIDDSIKNKIYTIHGLQVMLDSDLAELFEVETKNLNRAVNRNSDRFPQNFMFQLTEDEYQNLRFQNGTSSKDDSLRFQVGVLDNEEVLRSQFVTSSLVSQNVTPNQRGGRRKLKKFDSSHDRFLIIDGKEVYHIGASLKDLGKKWFAFSKFDVGALEILGRLK